MPFIIVLLSFWATYLHVAVSAEVMTWDFREGIRRPAPLQSDIRYVSLYDRSDLFQPSASAAKSKSEFGTILRPGNTSMYAGVEFINGYSPIQLASLSRTFKFALWGFLPPEESKRILKLETGSQGLLQLMGVDGLVVARSLRSQMQNLTKQGWRRVASLREGAVFHRVGARSPHIRSVSSVKIARSDNGKPLRVKALNLFLPAVQLPPGAKGQLVLQYRPMSLVIGSIVAAMTVLGIAVMIVFGTFNRTKIS
jgi:hypothetical protein